MNREVLFLDIDELLWYPKNLYFVLSSQGQVRVAIQAIYYSKLVSLD